MLFYSFTNNSLSLSETYIHFKAYRRVKGNKYYSLIADLIFLVSKIIYTARSVIQTDTVLILKFLLVVWFAYFVTFYHQIIMSQKKSLRNNYQDLKRQKVSQFMLVFFKRQKQEGYYQYFPYFISSLTLGRQLLPKWSLVIF